MDRQPVALNRPSWLGPGLGGGRVRLDPRLYQLAFQAMLLATGVFLRDFSLRPAQMALAIAAAVATQSGATLASGGAVRGRFFGASAAALAGTVKFDGARQHDTAFGGTKN